MKMKQMNGIDTDTPIEQNMKELHPGPVTTPHDIQSTEEMKQQSQRCAQATANLSASLALAATLCIDAGSDAAIALLVGSVAAAEMVGAYTDLTHDGPQENMYEVQYTAPVTPPSSQALLSFETVLQDFTTGLLQLNSALHRVSLSYGRLHATIEELENNQHEPEGALFQDAQFFATLQRQALWRNLKLCTTLSNNLLLLTPCVNVLWHQFRLRIPSRARFSEQNVRDTLSNIWQVRAQDIAVYPLNASGITDCTSMLHILIQPRRALTDPVVLIQEEWHQCISLLAQSFQHALDTFYSPLNDTAID